jgi:hypothetical protein
MPRRNSRKRAQGTQREERNSREKAQTAQKERTADGRRFTQMGVVTAGLLLMNYQSPDEQELVPAVEAFASLREIFLRLFFCAFCAFLRPFLSLRSLCSFAAILSFLRAVA